MRRCFLILLGLICGLAAPNAHAHFTGKGHVHTLSESRQDFLNPYCEASGTCDLKRFSLMTSAYEVWFSDDPDHPTYGNGAIMEYETDSVKAIEKYAVVQFVKGCVFDVLRNHRGAVARNLSYWVSSFGEHVPLCFPRWVIDSQDTDPVYNSDPQYGRFYLLRWNKRGFHGLQGQQYFGVQKPKVPVVYLTDYPAGAFVTRTGAKNVALQFKTCIYKSSDVPTRTARDHIDFATPLACFDWQSVYVYDFARKAFDTDRAHVAAWVEPSEQTGPHALVIVVLLFLVLALVTFARFGKSLRPSTPLAAAPRRRPQSRLSFFSPSRRASGWRL